MIRDFAQGPQHQQIFFTPWWQSTDFSMMGELKDLFPPEVLADWPRECLLLGTGRKSPTPVTLWRKCIHGFTNATSLPNTVPKEEWIYRDAKFHKWYGSTDTTQKKTVWSYIDSVTYNKAMYMHFLELQTVTNIHSPFTHPPGFQCTILPGSESILQEVKLLQENEESLFILPSHCAIVVICTQNRPDWAGNSVLWRDCSQNVSIPHVTT